LALRLPSSHQPDWMWRFILASLSGFITARMRCSLADARRKRQRGRIFDVFRKNFLKKSAPREKYSAWMLADSGKSSTFAAG